MTPEEALSRLEALSKQQKAGEMAAYHKVARRYLGVSNPEIDQLCRIWKKHPESERLRIAHYLWASDIHEARIGAAKLLSQPKLRDTDQEAWLEIQSWVNDFDAWAIADHACKAGSYRLLANPGRLDQVEGWTQSKSMWTHRAALVVTLPWARIASPDEAQTKARERILGWASDYVDCSEWFIQKSVSWWLRELSKRDPARTRVFLDKNQDKMKAFARKDAAKYL